MILACSQCGEKTPQFLATPENVKWAIKVGKITFYKGGKKIVAPDPVLCWNCWSQVPGNPYPGC